MKIMIFGRPGGGKSTFAVEIQKILKIPLYHLDKYFFIENWTKSWEEREYEEFLKIQQELVDKGQWIIDGNCLASLENRYSKATHCFYFNLSRIICIWRVLKRYFNKNTEIDDRPKNCKETITFKFVKYIWNFEKRVAPKITFLKKKYPGVKFYELKYHHLKMVELIFSTEVD